MSPHALLKGNASVDPRQSMVRLSGQTGLPARRMVETQDDLYEVLGVARDATEVQARITARQ